LRPAAHLTVKITDGCIVIIKDSEEVDELKREKDSLRLELLELKQTNQEIQNATKAAFQKIPGLTG